MKTTHASSMKALGAGLALAMALFAAPALAEDAAPTLVGADLAWLSTSTILVLLMVVPGLALFYGGLVRSKNMLSVLMQVLVTFSLIVVLWFIYGYSLAFTEGNAFFGGLDRLFLKGLFDADTGTFPLSGTVPELSFAAFQATFAGITCALIVGAFAERARFSAILLFMVLWFTFAYIPIAHMVWFGGEVKGFLFERGALDFAGGTVVHINAGVAGLIGAYVIGKRIGFGKEALSPHNLPMTMIGASLLWVGWFGFNAGSALAANNIASLAFMNTLIATAAAVLAWVFTEWAVRGHPSMLGGASGAVAGLDYLQALAGRADAEVVYESRKPVAAWRAELPALGIDPETLDASRVLFSGSAREAALRFPKNLNVAATLALAGIGMERTRVEVVVDPQARGNQHTVRVNSPLGDMQIQLVNAPAPTNPKTSWLVAQSVLSTIRRHLAFFTIG